MAGPGFGSDAELPKVPLLTDAAERHYVGRAYYLRGQPIPLRNAKGLIPDEVALHLYIYKDPEVREDIRHGGELIRGALVPQIIEVRQYFPGIPEHLLPLLRLMWDADRDGKGDYIAVVDSAKSGFHIYALNPKPRMSEQWYVESPSEAKIGD